MSVFQGQRAILTVTSVANLLSGQVYEFIGEDSLVEIGMSQNVTGLIASVSCDNNIAMQDVGESNIVVKATAPIYPDDMFISFECVAGSRLIIAVRNPTGGTITVMYAGRITPY